MPAIADTIDELSAEWFTAALHEGGVLPESGSVAKADNEIYGTGQFGFVVRSRAGLRGRRRRRPRSR